MYCFSSDFEMEVKLASQKRTLLDDLDASYLNRVNNNYKLKTNKQTNTQKKKHLLIDLISTFVDLQSNSP
jgi:hypothetical protein